MDVSYRPSDAAQVVISKKYMLPEDNSKKSVDNEGEEKVLEIDVSPEYAESLPDDVLQRIAVLRGKKQVAERQVTVTQKDRDPFVSEHVKRRANGMCDLCNMPAPFKDKKNKPYLESHQVKWLSDGGEDTIENTVALCPNCHRKMHVINDSDEVKTLQSALVYYKRKGL